MDAGLAAVLGALAGALGTTLAGVSTGWATREQAKISARAEHHRQRCEPREAAYRAFITASNALIAHMDPKYGLPSKSPLGAVPPSREFADKGRKLTQTVREAWQEIVLLGPDAVAEAATAAEHEAFQLSGQCIMHQLSEKFETSPEDLASRFTRAHTRYGNFKQSITAFTGVAREALDSDGTS